MRQLINSNQNKLDNLFAKYSTLPPDDIELHSHWTRYLCVLASGYIEISIRHIYSSYARDKTDPKTAKYISSQLERFRNPKMGNIVSLTRMFDDAWAIELETETEDKIKNSVDSIVNNRHQIAHGRDTNISYSYMKSYYDDAKELIELLMTQCSD